MKKKKRGGAEAELVRHLEELGASLGNVQGKRMFGGYGLFVDGVMFGLMDEGVFYFKVDAENTGAFDELELPWFTYLRQGKRIRLSYRRSPEGALENARGFCRWARGAIRAAKAAKK